MSGFTLRPFTAYRLPLTIVPMRNVIALIVLVMQLAACGYKGALYLPPETPAVGGPAPEPAPENENKKPASQ